MSSKRCHWFVLGLLLALISSAGFAAGFVEEIVSFSTHDGLTLEGVLTYPAGEVGPFPGMLLIAGSGLQDADVSIHEPTLSITYGMQKHFQVLSRHFSRNGWAVLRYNKRGASFDHIDDRPDILKASSLDDLVEDARSALRELLRHPKVAAKPLVIYGHSEGTMVATRLAADQGQLDLLVLAGSVAGDYSELLEYQLVDRNLMFFRQAADTDGDGALTRKELNALDNQNGMGSIYVRNSAELLFELVKSPSGTSLVRGFNPATDRNADGQLQIADEIDPALRAAASRLVALGRTGVLGEYLQSLLMARPNKSIIHRVNARVLFVHGELDVQTPLDEALILMAKMESNDRSDYDALFLPNLGHTFSPPNDYFAGDGKLSILDNLTLNVPKFEVRRRLLGRIEDILQIQ
jgi:pimeloyl-ACP methyl ester carboxylesterase